VITLPFFLLFFCVVGRVAFCCFLLAVGFVFFGSWLFGFVLCPKIVFWGAIWGGCCESRLETEWGPSSVLGCGVVVMGAYFRVLIRGETVFFFLWCGCEKYFCDQGVHVGMVSLYLGTEV